MNRFIVVLSLLLTCPAKLLAAEPLTVKQTLQNYAKTWESGDVDKMLAFYESSDDVLAVVSSGQSFEGQAGVRKMYQSAFSEANWSKVKLAKLKIHQQGSIAWATCRFQAELVTKLERTKFQFTSQGLFVLKQSAGSWKIVSEHFSPIHGVERVRPVDVPSNRRPIDGNSKKHDAEGAAR